MWRSLFTRRPSASDDVATSLLDEEARIDTVPSGQNIAVAAPQPSDQHDSAADAHKDSCNSSIEEPKPTEKAAYVDTTSVRGMVFGLFLYSLSTGFTTGMSTTAKLAGSRGVPVFEITLFRGLVCLLFIIPSLVRDRVSPLGNRRGLLLLRGLLGFGSGATLYASVQYLPISDATVLSFLSPLWVAVTGPLFINEQPSRVVWYILPACIGGVMMVSKPTFLFKGVEALSTVGVILGCSQAIFSGSVRMSVRDLRKSEKPSVVIFYLAAVTVIFSLAFCATVPNGYAWPPKKDQMLLCLATGLFAYGNQMSMTHALRYTKASTAVALSYLSIIWAELASIFIFKEYPEMWDLLGALLIGVCTGILAVAERRKHVKQIKSQADLLSLEIDADKSPLQPLLRNGSDANGEVRQAL